MERSESIDKVAAALFAVQGKVHNMRPNKKGFGYDYVDLPSIIDAVKPVLQEHKLMITQFPYGDAGSVGITTMLMHESGQYLSQDFVMPVPTMAKMNDAQAAGAVITYARRYALSAILGITADEDVDAAPERSQTHEKAPLSDPSKLKDSMVLKLKNAMDNGLYSEEEFTAALKFVHEISNPAAIEHAARELDKKLKERASSH